LIAAESCASDCPYGLAATTKGDIYTIAGTTEANFYYGEAIPATEAVLYRPEGLAVDDAGDLLISDSGNQRVRLVAAATCSSNCPFGLPATTKGDIYTITGTGTPGFSGDDSAASDAEIFEPHGLAVDNAGNLLISDTNNERVRLVAHGNCAGECGYGLTATTKNDIYTIAGNGRIGSSGDGGSARAAELSGPSSLAIGNTGDLLISDTGNARIRQVAEGGSTAPVFTAANPPENALAGSSLEYTFSATGSPSPTYNLDPDAPSWLTINPTSGRLTGVVPPGVEDFSYSVTATNSFGQRTAGPFFTASAAQVLVTGTVKYSEGAVVEGAVVDACVIGSGLCYNAATNSSGTFEVGAIAGTTIVLSAYPYPTQGSSQQSAPEASEPMLVPADGLPGQTITLGTLAPLSTVTLINPLGGHGEDGPNTLAADYPSRAVVHGCPYGLATVSVIARRDVTGPYESDIEPLSEDQPGSGTYSGELEPQEPLKGPAEIQDSVSCPPQSSLFPSLGPSTGDNAVIVTGSSFTGATAVDFGNQPASSYRVLSEDGIEAVAPAGSGTVPVTVYGPDILEGGTVVDQYTYVAISSVSPAEGPLEGGTKVIIKGTGLASATAVRFGKTGAQFTQVSSDELQALSPPGEGTQDITVETAYGGRTPISNIDEFSYGAGAHGDVGTGSPPVGGPRVSRVTPAGDTQLVRTAAPVASSRPAVSVSSASLVPNVGAAAVMPRGWVLSGGIAPAITPGGLGLKILDLVYEYGPHTLSGLGILKNDIQLALYNFGDLCPSSGGGEGSGGGTPTPQAIKDAIALAITLPVDAFAAGITPAIELLVGSALAELGPVGYAVALAIVPSAVLLMVSQLADTLVDAAVDAALDTYCKKQKKTEKPNEPKEPEGSGGNGNFKANSLIDPSGTVLDRNGGPISEATVSILRSESWEGPFSPVDVQAPGIEPAENPETTGAKGVFHWEVDSGFYEVQASAPGCTATGEPGQNSATVGPYPVPPPQVGLTITLACPDEAPAPAPSVESLSESTGPASGGTTVTMIGSGFTPSSTVTFGATPGSDGNLPRT